MARAPPPQHASHSGPLRAPADARTAAAAAPEYAPEGMGGDHKPTGRRGCLTQFRGLIEARLITVQTEGQHMTEVGLHLHGADQHHVV